MSESEITQFFSNQTVFLTGGTGFLGKILVEKILRVCQIKKIYLLVRPKKGKSVDERFEEYFKQACFENITEGNKLKVVLVNGDCEQPNLGLTTQSEEMIISQINIIIHAAANVKFDQPLRQASYINVGSTVDILNLAKKIPQLKSFIYVSTLYSNCTHKLIEEKSYPFPMLPKELFGILDSIPDDATLAAITPILMRNWPNTYTFTKAIAEACVAAEEKRLPVGIVRPAIVTSTAKEPMPGWTDNIYGILGITCGVALGVIRSFHGKPNSIANIVPCDFVANHTLAATYDTAQKRTDKIKIYNFCSSEINYLTFERYQQLTEKHYWELAPFKAMWYIGFKVRENLLWHKICFFLFQTIYAYMFDFGLICFGRKPFAVKKCDRLNKSLNLISYFTIRNWTVISDNTKHLWKIMNIADKKLFNFNLDDIDFDEFCKNSLTGIRIYILNDPLDTIPKTKKKVWKLFVAHYTCVALFWYSIFKLLYFVASFFL